MLFDQVTVRRHLTYSALHRLNKPKESLLLGTGKKAAKLRLNKTDLNLILN